MRQCRCRSGKGQTIASGPHCAATRVRAGTTPCSLGSRSGILSNSIARAPVLGHYLPPLHDMTNASENEIAGIMHWIISGILHHECYLLTWSLSHGLQLVKMRTIALVNVFACSSAFVWASCTQEHQPSERDSQSATNRYFDRYTCRISMNRYIFRIKRASW
jgi:hypothetical protein